MNIPKSGDKLLLKSTEELLSILRAFNWNGNDENRIKIAEEYGDKIVNAKDPQDHHSYCFTKEGPTIHYTMIKEIL